MHVHVHARMHMHTCMHMHMHMHTCLHISFKGLIGECGQRGGYLEMVGFSDATRAQFTKVANSPTSPTSPTSPGSGTCMRTSMCMTHHRYAYSGYARWALCLSPPHQGGRDLP